MPSCPENEAHELPAKGGQRASGIEQRRLFRDEEAIGRDKACADRIEMILA